MKEKFQQYLKKYMGSAAQFREGQLEALEEIMNGKRVLLVQKTGWGKSLIYFFALKYFKENNPNGVGIIVTPLLALIRDQIENAEKFGIRADKLTSDQEPLETEDTMKKIEAKSIDLLFVSPERFGNSNFKEKIFPKLDVILFVIDEAHCISDWGHDFRPDYMRLVDAFASIPRSTPLILTTATANDRVVNDIQTQFGSTLEIMRGPLVRNSLKIQVIHLLEKERRMAWLKDHIMDFVGSGIIYVSTVADADKLSGWLKKNNINVESYHGRLEPENRIKRERKLKSNEVKALIATTALGMGFDKGDISFVIHFQAPGSLVTYYQQIGRAGRNIDNADIVLLCGAEDQQIQRSFIEQKASEGEMKMIWEKIYSLNGATISEILSHVNLTKSKVEKCLKILLVKDYIYKDGSKYYITPKEFVFDMKKEQLFTANQELELEEMKKFTETDDCYMKYIAYKLSDFTAEDCGKCFNCTKETIVSVDITEESVAQAVQFLNSETLKIKPRKKLPNGLKYRAKNTIPEDLLCEEGRALALYGDVGYGERIKREKYLEKYFSDEIVKISAEYIRTNWQEVYHTVKWLTCIPSFKNKELVENFAKRLATELNLPFSPAIIKTKQERPEQKMMQNSQNQYHNAETSLDIDSAFVSNEPVLLVDDIVDSRFSFMTCGMKLKDAGSGAVFPFALACTSINIGGGYDE